MRSKPGAARRKNPAARKPRLRPGFFTYSRSHNAALSDPRAINGYILRQIKRHRTGEALENVIDRAKGMIMKARGVGEDEAYAILRKAAMNQSKSLAEVAEALVLAAGLLS